MKLNITFIILSLLTFGNIASGQLSNYLNVPNVEDVRVYEDVYETYRLPNNTRPFSYQIDLRTRIHEENFVFEGFVEIVVLVSETTNRIVMHSRQLNITNFLLRDLNGFVLNTTMSYDPIREFLVFEVSENLLGGSRFWLEITYVGTLRTDGAGFYRSSYLNDDGERVWLATTQFEATDARHAFPCYDEPAIKAIFIISITHDPSYSAVSNMPVNRQEPNDDGSVTTFFNGGPPTSTYLIAFIVSDFEFLENEFDGRVPHRTLARPNAVHLTEFALQTGVDMLDALNDYIGVSYTLPKMDQAAIPDFSGAMENWGLVTYSESSLFYNTNESTISSQAGTAGIIGHEFAHQWFGNLVSPRWWTYLWLNEGFATLFGNVGVHLLYPGWSHEEYFVATNRYGIFRSDALAASHPMSHHVETPLAIDAMFNNVAYGKAALVLRMFADVFSRETFLKGVRYYLIARSLSDADEDDLFDGLQRAVIEDNTILPPNTNTQILMSSWTRQTGFPIVQATRDYNTTSNVTFTQRRFMSQPTSTPDNSVYWVPIFVGLPSDASNASLSHPILWLSNASQSLEISELASDDWLVVNKLSSGYYRVLYDRQNYRLITNALIENIHVLSTVDKASLIDDLYTFCENDLVTYDVFFDLLRYMQAEYFYEPWYIATQALTSIVRRFEGQANNVFLRDFVRLLSETYFEYTGHEDQDDEHRLRKYSRNIAITWACNMGSQLCRRATNGALRSIIASNGEFHQNVRSVLYCASLRNGDRSDYEFVWNRLLASNDQSYRYMLISALGCTEEAFLMEEFLNSSLNSTNTGDFVYRSGEHIRIFNAVYQSGSEGLNMALAFLISNLEEAALTFGQNNIGNIVIGIAERLTLYTQSNEFGNLLYSAVNNNYINVGVVERALDITRANQLWFFKHEAVIAAWLQENFAMTKHINVIS
ncbi:hypothetical protein HA402_004842 [Bradysia odoriphaga]|nr:hypothetical protein HA402_004842 [Bradysia odoriphaga]